MFEGLKTFVYVVVGEPVGVKSGENADDKDGARGADDETNLGAICGSLLASSTVANHRVSGISRVCWALGFPEPL